MKNHRKKGEKMNENELMSSLPVPKAVAKMAIPSVMSSLVTVVYNMADTFFCRTDRRSAAGGGSQPDKPDLYTVSAFVTYAALIVGVALAVILMVFMTPVLNMFGANEQTFLYAKGYTFHIAYGAPFIIWSAAASFVVRAEGASKEAMIGSMIGTVANIVSDPVLISGMGMGAAGAAVATTIGNILASIYYLWYFLKKSKYFSISIQYFTCKDGILSGVCVTSNILSAVLWRRIRRRIERR